MVEEIPAYEPCGAGEHLYLWIEKCDISHDFLMGHLARTLRLRRDDIGSAGLKDRRAITRQWISVPGACADRVGAAETDQIFVLDARQHGNKLRTGHLRGNRFSIRVRGVASDATDVAQRLAEAIRTHGFPNYFGDQRFGIDGETLTLGQQLLSGEKIPADLPRSKRKFLTRLAVSAVQSWLFNQVVAWRVQDRSLNFVLSGDVMQVVASGGLFISDSLGADQPRLDAGEIVPTGPLFGPKMKHPRSITARVEEVILERSGLRHEHFTRFKKLTPGGRRSVVIWPEDLMIEAAQPEPVAEHMQPSTPSAPWSDRPGPTSERDLWLHFRLPPGAYATMLLREFMKSESPPKAVPTESVEGA